MVNGTQKTIKPSWLGESLLYSFAGAFRHVGYEKRM